MKILKDSNGFSAIELIVILVVFAGLAGAGYMYMKMKNNSDTTATTTSTSTAPTSNSQSSSGSIPTAPQVNSNKDLDTALNTLNQTNLDDGSSDGTQLGTQSSAF